MLTFLLPLLGFLAVLRVRGPPCPSPFALLGPCGPFAGSCVSFGLVCLLLGGCLARGSPWARCPAWSGCLSGSLLWPCWPSLGFWGPLGATPVWPCPFLLLSCAVWPPCLPVSALRVLLCLPWFFLPLGLWPGLRDVRCNPGMSVKMARSMVGPGGVSLFAPSSGLRDPVGGGFPAHLARRILCPDTLGK